MNITKGILRVASRTLCLVAISVALIGVSSGKLRADTIVTVAGSPTAFTGRAAYGDGGLATAANLGYPDDVDVDGAGNLYIGCQGCTSGSYPNAIRKVTRATSLISTLGRVDHTGPAWIGHSASGDIYYLSYEMVFKLTASGSSVLVAGGSGSSCSLAVTGLPATSVNLGLCSTRDFAVDPSASGDIYIAVATPGKVFKVSGGLMTTVYDNSGPAGVAGSSGTVISSGTLSANPIYGIASAGDGNLYISESRRILKVDSSGAVSTVITSADAGGAGFRSIAAFGDFIYVRSSDFRVREIFRPSSSSPYIVTVVAGNGTYGYSGDGGSPTAASIGGAGIAIHVTTQPERRGRRGAIIPRSSTVDIYLAETSQHVVREFTLTRQR